jgi:DNA-binding winged helix-turn-helix (wHTH) protein
MTRPVKQLYEFGPFCLDPAEHTLLRDGQPIQLRPKVYDLLVVLVENRGRLVDKEQLMSSVWAEQFVEEGNINKNISMLRQALGESDGGTKFIETVPKMSC